MSQDDRTEHAAGIAIEGRPDDPGAYQFWAEEKLRNMDTDQFGHVNNAAIASFCESGRMSLFAGADLVEAMAPYSVVVVRLLIEFHAELFFPGSVRIGTTVTGIGNTSIQVTQSVFRDSRRVASSMATCVLIDRSSNAPAPVPAHIRARLQSVRPSLPASQTNPGAPNAD